MGMCHSYGVTVRDANGSYSVLQDYIFSVIKKFRQNPNFILPDRAHVTMSVPFMEAYVKLLIKTCHRRGVHAMVNDHFSTFVLKNMRRS